MCVLFMCVKERERDNKRKNGIKGVRVREKDEKERDQGKEGEKREKEIEREYEKK